MLEALPSNDDQPEEGSIPVQPVSLDIWDKKYRLKSKKGDCVDKEVDDTYLRVARALSEVEEKEVQEEWSAKFLWALQNGAIPAGRITSTLVL